MATFPIYQLPKSAVKARFNEPRLTEALNLKNAGVIPPGIYRGYDPNPQANFQLFINTDPVSNDSVAVVEMPSFFNLTIRFPQQIVLDFTGHDFGASGDLYVVIRADYSITPQPFAGVTDAKILAIKVGDLQQGDLRIARVTGVTGTTPDISTVIEDGDRDEVTALVTQEDFRTRMQIAVAEFPVFVGGTQVRTLVHNFGLTGITAIGGSTTLYQTDQGLVLLTPYLTGWGEFSDTSTDWGFLVNGALTANDWTVTQINARAGRSQFNMTIMLFKGVTGISGGGIPPAPAILVVPASGAFPAISNPAFADIVFNVFNTGTAPLTVSSITPPATPEFGIVADTATGVIPAGGVGMVTVRFSPPPGPGIYADSITINSDDPTTPALVVPLSGTGL